ncbi:hypothetical protein FQR65_LT07558 [Abscondita terminalis]|nr:hypothetical protein FQR65_LT07558 [Abscondita terminalis]
MVIICMPQLQSNTSTTPLTNDEGSWIVSVYPIVSIFGSILLALTLDVFGRKTMLLLGTLPFCGAWLLIAFARENWIIVIARIVAGIADGIIFPCIPLYLAEVCDPNIRGFLITGCKIFQMFGMLVINLLGEFLSINVVAVICSVLTLGVLLCLRVPESPYFYMIKNDDAKAKVSMELYNKNGDIESIRNALNEQRAHGGKWMELFTERSNRKKLCLSVIFKALQLLTGFMCLIFYAKTVFQEIKHDTNPIIFVTVYNALQILMLTINSVMIDKFGRKPLIAVSTFTVATALLVVSVYSRCLCTLQPGLNDGWSSFALPQFLGNTSTIPITNDEGSWVASAFPIGSIFGSILAALTVDVFGRKRMLLTGTLPLCVTWLIIGFARTIVELCVARFVAGISEGFIFSCVPLYLAEVSDPKIRGFLLTGTSTAYITGIFLINLLGAFLSIKQVAIISSLLTLGVLLCLLVPESPYFYMMKEDYQKATISLKMFNKNADIDVIRNALKEQKSKNGKWLEIFTDSSNRKSLGLVFMIRFFQQFSGTISIIFYTQTVFQESRMDIDPTMFVCVYYVLQIIVMIINSMIIDKIGRRPLLITSISTVAVSLCTVSVYFSLKNMTEVRVTDYFWWPICGLFLYIIGFTLGLQNIPYMLASEIFPLHVKGFAVAFNNILYGTLAVPVLKFFQFTKDEFGMHVPFIVFTICSFCSIPFFIYCVPETKEKTLENIEKNLRLERTLK